MHVLDNYFDLNQVPDYCKKDFLEDVYRQYLHNLRVSPYKMYWVKLSQIINVELKEWTCIKDKYLEHSKSNPLILGLDIKRNGTYYPIIADRKEDGYFEVRDGAHRLHSLKLLQEEGALDKEHEILVMTKERHEHRVQGEAIVYHIPMMVVDEFKENYKNIYASLEDDIDYLDEKGYFAKFEIHEDCYLATVCMSLLMRNAMFEYKSKNKDIIQPAECINSKAAWKMWRGY